MCRTTIYPTRGLLAACERVSLQLARLPEPFLRLLLFLVELALVREVLKYLSSALGLPFLELLFKGCHAARRKKLSV